MRDVLKGVGVWAAWLGLVLALPVLAESPVESGKVFSGDEGIRVVVVPLKPASDKKAIVSVSGTQSEFDGKAQLCEVVSAGGSDTDYKTTWQGRPFTLLVVREQYGSKEYRLGVPGKRDSLRVSFNDKATQELKAEEVYALHLKQSKDGTLAAMQKFDRKAAEGKQEAQLGEKLERLNKACETKLSIKVNWSSITDDVLKSTSIASYCGNVLDGLRGLCSSKVGKETVAKKVASVDCQFGAALDVTLKGTALTLTTAKDAPNQEDFIKTSLEKKL